MLDRCIKYKTGMYDILLVQQMDLVQFGGFSYMDTESMKVVDRNRLLEILRKRLDKKEVGG